MQAFHLTSLGSMCILLCFLRLLQRDICYFVNGLDLFNLPFIRLDFCILNTVLCKDNNNVQGSKNHFADTKGQTLPSFTPVDFSETKDCSTKSVSLFYVNFMFPLYY